MLHSFAHVLAPAVVFAAGLHAAVATAPRQTIYVSPRGANHNPGTEARPLRTLQQAADRVRPGDAVVVEDGTYTAADGVDCPDGRSRAIVCLANGGTPDAPVTFRARHPRAARIDGLSNAVPNGFRFRHGVSSVRIEGFEIYGMGNPDGSASAIDLFEGGAGSVIANNDIHDIGRVCTDTHNGQTGIFVEQPGVTIERNHIHDIGRFAPGERGCAPRTAFYTNHDHGIYVDGESSPGARDVRIRDNSFANFRRGWAIQVHPGSIRGLSVLNNSFDGENPYQDGQIIIDASLADSRIAHNRFTNPRAVAISFRDGTHARVTIEHNTSSRRLTDRTPAGVVVRNNHEHRHAPPN